MIDKNIFSSLKKEMAAKDELREKIILKSRPIIKTSKKAIYAIHRDSMKEAKKYLDQAKKEIKLLKKELTVHAYHQALQEYTEAICYYYFVSDNKLMSHKEIDVDAENYLLGICDLTGELCRRAVFSVVNNKTSEVKNIKKFVDIIYEEFLDFNFRNSELRKKSDSIKYNVKKIDEILYDLKLRD